MRALSLAALVGTSVYGSAFWLFRDRGPGAEAVHAAAASIREGFEPGDLIFLVPSYATRALEDLGALGALAVRDPLAEDFDVHPRAWVLGLYGEGKTLRARMQTAGLVLESSAEPAPGLTVDRYRTGSVHATTFLFLEHLKDARVEHEKEDGTRVACSSWSDTNGQGGRLGGRWTCPYDGEWFYVAPEWHRMGETMRFCLWAHPPNQGRLVISFFGVPMTGQLAGRAGHTQGGSLHARAPIFFDVAVGSARPDRFTLPLDQTWRPFWIDTPSVGTTTVTFAVSTPDAGTNHFCFTAEMRTP